MRCEIGCTLSRVQPNMDRLRKQFLSKTRAMLQMQPRSSARTLSSESIQPGASYMSGLVILLHASEIHVESSNIRENLPRESQSQVTVC